MTFKNHDIHLIAEVTEERSVNRCISLELKIIVHNIICVFRQIFKLFAIAVLLYMFFLLNVIFYYNGYNIKKN